MHTVLSAAGFIVPAASAWVAYRRTRRATSEWPAGSYGAVAQDVPKLLQEGVDAVKWPAIWALSAVLAATVASILPLWVPVN